MRSVEEILENKRIKKVLRKVVNDDHIQLALEMHSVSGSDQCFVKFTRALGWEHLSVSHKNKIPSWQTMEEMKRIFWKDDEDAFQYHPIMDHYINNAPYCLHIWRPLETNIPMPPSITVGFRPNHIEEDVEWLKRVQEQLGNPVSDKAIELMKMTATEEGRKNLEKELMKMPREEAAKLAKMLI